MFVARNNRGTDITLKIMVADLVEQSCGDGFVTLPGIDILKEREEFAKQLEATLEDFIKKLVRQSFRESDGSRDGSVKDVEKFVTTIWRIMTITSNDDREAILKKISTLARRTFRYKISRKTMKNWRITNFGDVKKTYLPELWRDVVYVFSYYYQCVPLRRIFLKLRTLMIRYSIWSPKIQEDEPGYELLGDLFDGHSVDEGIQGVRGEKKEILYPCLGEKSIPLMNTIISKNLSSPVSGLTHFLNEIGYYPIIALQELELRERPPRKDYFKGYRFIWRSGIKTNKAEQPLSGGGVGFLIRSDISAGLFCEVGHRAKEKETEWIWLITELKGGRKLGICNVYCAEFQVDAKSFWRDLRTVLKETEEVLILGNFNTNLETQSGQDDLATKRAAHWMENLGFFNNVKLINKGNKQPTFNRTKPGGQIGENFNDWGIWIGKEEGVKGYMVKEAQINHHATMFFTLSIPFANISDAIKDRQPHYRKIVVDKKLCAQLCKEVREDQDMWRYGTLEGMVNRINDIASGIASKVFGKAKMKVNAKPYWDQELIEFKKKLNSKRHRCERLREKDRADELVVENELLRQLEIEFKFLMREKKRAYYVEKMRQWSMTSREEAFGWLSLFNLRDLTTDGETNAVSNPSDWFKVEEVLTVWEGIFSNVEEVKNEQHKWNEINLFLSYGRFDMLDLIKEEELMKVSGELKTRTSPGLDGIPHEIWMILFAEEGIRRFLVYKFNEILQGGPIPDSWKEARTVLIPKKDIPESPADFRPITLLQTLSKVFELILWSRIREGLIQRTDILMPQQGGFLQTRNSIEQVLTLRTIDDWQYYKGKPLFVCFLDIEKAFDSVPFCGILESLIERGYPWYLVNFVSQWCSNCTREIAIPGNTGKCEVYRGVPQGGVLSPFLFNIFIDNLLRSVEGACCGIQLTEDVELSCLAYADDLAIFSDDEDKLRYLIQIAENWATEWGLRFSVRKSKLMRLGRSMDYKNPPELYGTPLEAVKKFQYLGVIFNEDRNLNYLQENNSWRRAMEIARLGSDESWVGWLKNTPELPMGLLSLMARAVVNSGIIYGSEVFPINHSWNEEVGLFYKAIARVGEKCSTSATLSFLGFRTLEDEADMRMIKFAVKLCRSEAPLVSLVADIVVRGLKDGATGVESWSRWSARLQSRIREMKIEEEFWEAVEGYPQRLKRKLREMEPKPNPLVPYNAPYAHLVLIFRSEFEDSKKEMECPLCKKVINGLKHMAFCEEERAGEILKDMYPGESYADIREKLTSMNWSKESVEECLRRNKTMRRLLLLHEKYLRKEFIEEKGGSIQEE